MDCVYNKQKLAPLAAVQKPNFDIKPSSENVTSSSEIKGKIRNDPPPWRSYDWILLIGGILACFVFPLIFACLPNEFREKCLMNCRNILLFGRKERNRTSYSQTNELAMEMEVETAEIEMDKELEALTGVSEVI